MTMYSKLYLEQLFALTHATFLFTLKQVNVHFHVLIETCIQISIRIDDLPEQMRSCFDLKIMSGAPVSVCRNGMHCVNIIYCTWYHIPLRIASAKCTLHLSTAMHCLTQ